MALDLTVTPTIEVDALTYYMAIGAALFFMGLWGLWFMIKISRNTELKLRLAKMNWIYIFFTSRTGAIRKLIIPEKLIAEDGGFDIGKERYYAVNRDDKGQITVFNHRGKRAYQHNSGNPMPHAITQHSLDSMFTPAHMHQLHEGMVKDQLETIRPISSRDTLILILVGLILVVSITGIYLTLKQTDILSQIQNLLHPATVTTPTPTNPNPGVPG